MTIDQFINSSDGKINVLEDFRAEAERELSPKMVVCIPDMHLLERKANDDFYDNRPEYIDRFTAFLDFLLTRKENLKDAMQVVQLGDMYDLWQAKGNTNLISGAYPTILGLLDELETDYLIGNHDIELLEYSKRKTFGRKYRHRSMDSNKKVSIIYEHGFQADFFNNQGSWSGDIGRGITVVIGFAEFLEPDIDIILDEAWTDIHGAFDKYNDKHTAVKNRAGFNSHEYLDYYLDLMKKFNDKGVDDQGNPADLTLCVVGHTHTPRLASGNRGGREYFLMDCGSWVNGGHEFGLISGKEMAVCRWG